MSKLNKSIKKTGVFYLSHGLIIVPGIHVVLAGGARGAARAGAAAHGEGSWKVGGSGPAPRGVCTLATSLASPALHRTCTLYNHKKSKLYLCSVETL